MQQAAKALGEALSDLRQGHSHPVQEVTSTAELTGGERWLTQGNPLKQKASSSQRPNQVHAASKSPAQSHGRAREPHIQQTEPYLGASLLVVARKYRYPAL